MAAHRRQIRNLLLNRRYQLKFTLIMVVLSALLTAGLGAFWYDEMRNTSRILEVQALATMGEGEVQQIRAQLAESDHQRLGLLVGFGVLLSVLLTGYGIVLTHKVAGPIHKVQHHLNDVRDGKLDALRNLRNLRKGDQLHELWSAFTEMHATLRADAQLDEETLGKTIQAIERLTNGETATHDELLSALKELHGLRAKKVASIGL